MLFIKAGRYPITTEMIRREYPRIRFPRDIRPADVAQFDYEKVKEVAPPAYDKSVQRAVELPPQKTGGKWVQQWQIVPKWKTLDEAKDDLLEKADKIRERVSTSNFPALGKKFPADDAGKAAVMEARAFVAQFPARSARLKKNNGRIFKADAATVEQIFTALGDFLDACWDAYETHQNAIDALVDMDAAVNYHVGTGWP